MELLTSTLTAAAITALIVQGAANKTGESLAEGSLNRFSQLFQLVRNKFEERDKIYLLEQAEENREVIEAELIEQMQEDQGYQEHLKKLLESMGITRQVVINALKVEDSIEVEGIDQDINLKDFGSRLVEQIGISNTTATNIKIGKVYQKINLN
ncbi:hypothetical protein [Moorena sp. SIO3H5]|uniref:hypothetical protein n=1 Tax=Moorena sp. SIO3H5 TaxID=2607834 RepID=UPI0013BCFF3C|nr:hypothetical protein [Moorena sp. SIO3H5]NEO71895.1 hypothetical protein [Moorena sp. SIO3H5]